MQLAGYYEDCYEKREGRWVMTETRFKPCSTVTTSYASQSIALVSAGETPSF